MLNLCHRQALNDALGSLGWLAFTALLTACGGDVLAGSAPQSSFRASWSLHGIAAPASARRGIYVGLGTSDYTVKTILGYPFRNRNNVAPTCAETPGVALFDLAVDGKGNLMVPAVGGDEVLVYRGAGMCGPLLGRIRIKALSVDVASANAQTGTIIVGTLQTIDPSGFGNLTKCTLAAGCTATLTNQNINSVFGVALAKNGDCWASAAGFSATILVYFKHCSGTGQVATGFMNKSPGGLDVDTQGNLVSVDQGQGFWVYKGCSPACTVVAGPFPYEGYTLYGHLNENSTEFAAGDYQYGQVDIYKYRYGMMNYKYSFNNGISSNDLPYGAAFNPASSK